jgi:hypothetical protein
LRRAIAFGPPKEAALYFDEVFPLDLGAQASPLAFRDVSQDVPFYGEDGWDKAVLKSLLGSEELVSRYIEQAAVGHMLQFAKTFEHDRKPVREFKNAVESEFFQVDEIGFSSLQVKDLLSRYEDPEFSYDNFAYVCRQYIKNSVAATKFEGCCLWLPYPQSGQQPSEAELGPQQLHVTLGGLKLANVESVP